MFVGVGNKNGSYVAYDAFFLSRTNSLVETGDETYIALLFCTVAHSFALCLPVIVVAVAVADAFALLLVWMYYPPTNQKHMILFKNYRESTWLLWSRITGLEEDVAVAVWGERLGYHANQADDTEWWNILQQVMTWWDPLARLALEKANKPGVFGVATATATLDDPDLLDAQVEALTELDATDVAASLERLSIPAFADMVFGVVALQRNLWQTTLQLAGLLENQHGNTHAVAWVLYQFLFEFFAKNGTLLDWPLGAREARKSWVNEFQWGAGRVGRQCFTEGFEIISQSAAGSLLRDVCSYAVTRLVDAQKATKDGVTKRPLLTADQRMAMDERVIQSLAGKRPLIEADAPTAYQENVSPIQAHSDSDGKGKGIADAESQVLELEEESAHEHPTQPAAHFYDVESAEEEVDVQSSNEGSEEEHVVEPEEASEDYSSNEPPSQPRPGSKQEDAIEVIDDSDEEAEEAESISNDNQQQCEEDVDDLSDKDRHKSDEEEHVESEEDSYHGHHEADEASKSGEDSIAEEIDNDEEEKDNAEALEEEEEEEEEPEEVIAEIDHQGDDILIIDDDGAEADVSEEAAEDVRPPVARQVIDGDENYYATAEESQDDEDIAQALSQDESHDPSSRSYRFPPSQSNVERHVRIDATIQPVKPAPKLDDGYIPSDGDEMPAPPPVRVHHERDGYQGGESSLCHTEDDDEEISEAAEDEDENPIVNPAENGVSTPRAPPALDSHSLSGMSMADEQGPEEESSELEEANESDQVHFPVTHSIRTTVQPANASLEDYAVAAAAAQQESMVHHQHRSRHSLDTTNRLSIGSPERLSHYGSEDDAVADRLQKQTGEPQSVGKFEHSDAHLSGDDAHDDGGDEGTVMGDHDDLELDHEAIHHDGMFENQNVEVEASSPGTAENQRDSAAVDGETPTLEGGKSEGMPAMQIQENMQVVDRLDPFESNSVRSHLKNTGDESEAKPSASVETINFEQNRESHENAAVDEAAANDTEPSGHQCPPSAASKAPEPFMRQLLQGEAFGIQATVSSMTVLATAKPSSPGRVENTEEGVGVEPIVADDSKDSDVMVVDEKDGAQIVDEEIAGPAESTSMITDKEEIPDPMMDDDDAEAVEKMDDDDEGEEMAVDDGDAMAVEVGDKGVEDVEMVPAIESVALPDEEMKDELVEPAPASHTINVFIESSMAVDEDKSQEVNTEAGKEEEAAEIAVQTESSNNELPAESPVADAQTLQREEISEVREPLSAITEHTIDDKSHEDVGSTTEPVETEPDASTDVHDKSGEELTIVSAKALEPIPEEQTPEKQTTVGLVDLVKASVADPASFSAQKKEAKKEEGGKESVETKSGSTKAVSHVPPKSGGKRRNEDDSTATSAKVPVRRSSRTNAGKRSIEDNDPAISAPSRSKGPVKKTTQADTAPKTPGKSLPPRPPKSAAAKTVEKDAGSVASSARYSTRSATKRAAKKGTPAKPSHDEHHDDISVLSVGSAEGEVVQTNRPTTRRSARLAESDLEDASRASAPSKAGGSIRPRRLNKDGQTGEESVASSKSTRSGTPSVAADRTRRTRATAPKTPESASTATKPIRQTRSSQKKAVTTDEVADEKERGGEEKPDANEQPDSKPIAKKAQGGRKATSSKKQTPSSTRKLRSQKKES